MPRPKTKVGNRSKIKAGFQALRATGGGMIKSKQTPRGSPSQNVLWGCMVKGQRAKKEREDGA